jgi:hypothetical protein
MFLAGRGCKSPKNYASKEPNRQKALREINSANRGVFEQGNLGGCKPILKFLVMAYENTKVVGGRDWRVFSKKKCTFFAITGD